MQDQSIPVGVCQCGCGAKTKIAPRTRTRFGHTKGQPQPFLVGHRPPKPPPIVEQDCGYETPCHVWVGTKSRGGYAKTTRRGKAALVHRWYYEQAHGPIPEGLQLDHLCRNRACCNPDHLEPVTHAENQRRGKSAKLTAAQVQEIRMSNERGMDIAVRLGVSRATVSYIRSGKRWTAT